jgi:transglutaminase-like putative cysteine protease
MNAPLPFRSPACFLILFAAVLAIGPVRGDADRYAGGNFALVDAKKTLAAAADITLDKYPNCDQAIVDEKIVQVYRADGTGENQDEAFTKVLTEKGKENNRTISLGFQLPYSTVDVTKLEVLKPTGEVIPVDVAANSKVTIDTSQIQENIYDPNSKILQVSIPELEIGDIVHVVARTTIERPVIPGEFADVNVFEGEGFIRHTTYEVHAPLDKPLKHVVLRDEVPGTVQYTTQPGEDHTLVHRWEINNVPRMFSEPSMPPFENVLQRVLVSTTPTWQDVSKWYWNLSKPHLEATSPDLIKKVADLTAGAKTDMDKIKALFYYVSPNIRYMGLTPEKDRPGFEPHDVCLTFGKKYGVCRDKAALLVSMLRAAGLKSYPVLVSVGSKKDPEVPDAGFNHAIVCVELQKGQYTLMDPTDEHARDIFPLYDGDQSYLVTRPEGENIQTSPFAPPEHNMMRIRTTGTLAANGELDAKSELWFDGANDDVYRDAFSHMKPDDIRRFFEQNLKLAMPGARLTSLKVTPADMLDMSANIKAEIEFSVSGMTAASNGIMRDTGLDQRKYPMLTTVACGLDEEVALKLGDGFADTVSTPTCAPVDDDCLGYGENVVAKDGTLDCSRQLKLKVVEFSPAQYLELKQTLKDMDYDARKAPILNLAPGAALALANSASQGAAPPVDSNTIILDVHKKLTVTDAHTAVLDVKYSKLILTYAGKVREAEVKINFNPSCEEARFIRGVVTSKSGQRQEISNGELNVMDDEASGSAKRYTGGKILVASLPGVEIGSTIEVEYEVTMKNKPFVSGFEAFQLPDELRRKSFQLDAPDQVTVQQMVTSADTILADPKSSATGLSTLSWTAKNMAALPAEPQAPPDWVCIPGVSYFVGDFKAYLKELNDTMLNRSQSRTQVDALTKQITAAATSKLDAVRAIRDFVAKSIRLAGPSFTDLPLSELSTADTTLADGYGHGADRAILLHAMLSAAGFQPEFVLASGLPPVKGIKETATTFPLPEAFDTPLVKVTLDGVTYYLNDTDEYAQLGTTASDNRLGIDLSSQAYEVIASAKDCQDRTDKDYALTLGDDGKLRMKVTEHFYGGEYNTRNRYFSQLRPEERKRYYQELISDVAQGARPLGDLTTRFDTYPGTEQFDVELDHYAVVDGKYFYFDLPSTPSLFDLPGGDHRSLPLMLWDAGKENTRTEIVLPPSFPGVVIPPASENLVAPAGSGTVQMTTSDVDGKYVLTQELDSSPAIISPQDYPALLQIESTLEKKSGDVFLLGKDLRP